MDLLVVVAKDGNGCSRVGSLGHYCCMQIYEHYATPEVFTLASDIVQLASQSDLGRSVLFKCIQADPGE